jgi:hypothetical protein
MATPMGWENRFGFVCAPSHATYRNARREGGFTVSFPRPEQIHLVSLAAGPRGEGSEKPTLGELPLSPARRVAGMLLDDAFLHLECEQTLLPPDRSANPTGEQGFLPGHHAARATIEKREAAVASLPPLDSLPVLYRRRECLRCRRFQP